MEWLKSLSKSRRQVPEPPHPDLTVIVSGESIHLYPVNGDTEPLVSISSAMPGSPELAILVDAPMAGWLSRSEVRALIVALERLERGLG